MNNSISFLPSKLGLDFGGVIIPLLKRKSKEDTTFHTDFLKTEPFTDSIECISKLVTLFEGRVYIVSKAGVHMEELTRSWLKHQNFYSKTGLAEKSVHYCRTRLEKGPICQSLGLTHFVDDRIHVMQILKDIVPSLYLFGDKQKNHGERKWVKLTDNWQELFQLLLEDYNNSA